MVESTARFAVPLLVPGQGQKDVTHNEALFALEALSHPLVEAVGLNTPPGDAETGKAWVAGNAPTGAWTGRPGTIAYLTPGGWRHIAPVDGLAVWDRASGRRIRYMAGSWRLDLPRDLPALVLSPPAGGSTVDAEARAVVSAILGRLRDAGLLD